jgi:hypothetical protein
MVRRHRRGPSASIATDAPPSPSRRGRWPSHREFARASAATFMPRHIDANRTFAGATTIIG